MHVAATPSSLEVASGQLATFHVSITNNSPAIDAYQLQVFGVDPSWVTAEPSRLSLFPGDTENVAVTVALPTDYPASQRTLAINVSAENDITEFALTQVQLDVQPSVKPSVTVDPVVVTGGKEAVFGIMVTNEGNATMVGRAVGTDPEDLAVFHFEPVAVNVPPGRSQVVRVTATGGQAWFGQPRARTFELGVDTGDRHEAVATFIQRPRISRWMLSLLGLLLAAAVFAAVLSRTFGQVVEEASVDNRIIEQALASDDAGGVAVPVNPAGITGTVVSSTSADVGIAGVQADLFVADDTNVPIATAATDGNGVFTFARLNAGTFKLRFSGAGFDSIWFGGSTTPADAAEVTTVLGEVEPLGPFAIGGRPGSVSGRVLGDDPVGAVLTLTATGQLEPGVRPQVNQIEASADGSFIFEGVPSPAVYRLEVGKPGFATEARDVVLRPAQNLEDVELFLRSGDGVVSGVVASDDGPLGGVTIEATDGSVAVSTVSLTDGSVGSFALRNLPTPGRYTLTFARDGYAPVSQSVSLAAGEQLSSFNTSLTRATGSIRGTAFVGDEGPSGGITVTLTGGVVERQSISVSQGEVGSYEFDQLPSPGTYTVTFSRPGLVSQVRLVELDPRAGRIEATGVDATLLRDRAVVRGSVVLAGSGQLVPRAEVVLNDGITTSTFLTADEPLGEFEFAGVAPGTYTLTASRVGTTPVVVLVNVLANQSVDLQLELGAQASLSGQVRRFDPVSGTYLPYADATVALFTPSTFPGPPAEAAASTQTAADGTYSFTGLEAPADWVVAVFLTADSAEALDSTTIATEPGEDVPVPTIDVDVTL